LWFAPSTAGENVAPGYGWFKGVGERGVERWVGAKGAMYSALHEGWSRSTSLHGGLLLRSSMDLSDIAIASWANGAAMATARLQTSEGPSREPDQGFRKEHEWMA